MSREEGQAAREAARAMSERCHSIALSMSRTDVRLPSPSMSMRLVPRLFASRRISMDRSDAAAIAVQLVASAARVGRSYGV